ncbi:MAG TPA: hypothetical protein P5293_01405 [Bacteroidales bacterium]|nr:hypothetical protein [Bacteroidales bacterium]
MKKILLVILLILCFSIPSHASDVQWGFSIGIGQPGFYGRIDIGSGYPAPMCVYPQPMFAVYDPYYNNMPILYLYVPSIHITNWGAYCHHYNACNRRVHFVQDRWYHNIYVPAYRHRHGDRPPKHYYDHGQYRGNPMTRQDPHFDSFGRSQPRPPVFNRGGGFEKGRGHK